MIKLISLKRLALVLAKRRFKMITLLCFMPNGVLIARDSCLLGCHWKNPNLMPKSLLFIVLIITIYANLSTFKGILHCYFSTKRNINTANMLTRERLKLWLHFGIRNVKVFICLILTSEWMQISQMMIQKLNNLKWKILVVKSSVKIALKILILMMMKRRKI